jgi:hypothetical protein
MEAPRTSGDMRRASRSLPPTSTSATLAYFGNQDAVWSTFLRGQMNVRISRPLSHAPRPISRSGCPHQAWIFVALALLAASSPGLLEGQGVGPLSSKLVGRAGRWSIQVRTIG